MEALRVGGRCPWIRVPVLAIATLALLAGASCTSTAQPAGPDPGTPAEAEAQAGGAEEYAASAADTPADAADPGEPEELGQEIHFDDQGRPYRRLRIPKEEGRFKRVGEDRVQIPYGLLFYIADEAEDAFYVKLFVPPEELEEAGVPQLPAPAAAPEAAPARSLVAAEESDRLRFEPFDQGLPDSGQWRNGFDIADVDGDGIFDIVHGPARKGGSKPNLFLGDGRGGWRLWREARFQGPTLDYGDAEAADFNGDGITDLAFAVHLRGIAVFVGDGEGGFRSWGEGLEYASPEAHQGTAGFSSRAITSVDWNGDGRTDLLALGEGPSLGRPTGGERTPADFQAGARGPAVFLNQGDGTWERHAVRSEGREPFGDSLATGDFDGDGVLDFATATNGYGATGIVHLGRPDGTWSRVPVDALGSYTLVKALTAADLDGDGRDELGVGTLTFIDGEGFISAVEVLDLQPEGEWTRTTLRSIESQLGVWGIASGDVDGDGRLDLVASTGAGEVWVLLGTAAGGFRLEVSDEIQPPGYLCRGYHVELADLDGEPGDEVVVSFAGEPGSEQMIPGLQKHCPEQGALEVWKAQASE